MFASFCQCKNTVIKSTCCEGLCALSLSVCRCVKGEGEIEKLQTKVVELRRKLDDTTAAMQELGRENQSLQVSWETPSEQKQNRFESTFIMMVGLVLRSSSRSR